MKNAFRILIADLTKNEHERAFIRLLDEYARGMSGEGQSLPAAVKERVVPGLRRHPTARVYFAAHRRTIVGLATCFTGYSTFRGARLVNIHDLVVTKKYRRTGAASALIEHIAAAAAAEGACKLTLEVRADNREALALYEKQGFRIGAHPMYFMTKAVDPAYA